MEGSHVVPVVAINPQFLDECQKHPISQGHVLNQDLHAIFKHEAPAQYGISTCSQLHPHVLDIALYGHVYLKDSFSVNDTSSYVLAHTTFGPEADAPYNRAREVIPSWVH